MVCTFIVSPYLLLVRALIVGRNNKYLYYVYRERSNSLFILLVWRVVPPFHSSDNDSLGVIMGTTPERSGNHVVVSSGGFSYTTTILLHAVLAVQYVRSRAGCSGLQCWLTVALIVFTSGERPVTVTMSVNGNINQFPHFAINVVG